MKKYILFFWFTLGANCFAQVGVGTPMPDASTMLDVVANDKGILIPRVPLNNTTDATTITNGNKESLLVFNTQTINDVTPGYYYWYINKWQRLIDTDTLPPLIVSTLVDNGNGTFTYTNEIGGQTIIDFPTLVDQYETLTSITQDIAAGTLTYIDENHNSTVLNLPQLSKEPWFNQATATEATSNTQNIYQLGNIGIKTNASLPNVSLDVRGAVRGGQPANTSIGTNSVAFGSNNTASGNSSSSFGSNSNASGLNSISAGAGNVALSDNSATIGGLGNYNGGANSVIIGGTYNVIDATATSAVASGFSNRVSDRFACAFGIQNTASGIKSFIAGGNNNTASGDSSFASGTFNSVSGRQSAVFGQQNTITGIQTLVSGVGNIVNADRSFATGLNNTITSSGIESFTSGGGNTIDAPRSAAFGTNNVINGPGGSFAVGAANTASGLATFVVGDQCQALGVYDKAIGAGCIAKDGYSSAFGNQTIADGPHAFASGDQAFASNGATAIGLYSRANATSSIAMSGGTANGLGAMAFGTENFANGSYSYAVGRGNVAGASYESVFGLWGTLYTPLNDNFTDRVFNVGYSTQVTNRKDVFTILKNGKVGIGFNNFETTTNPEKLQINGAIRTTGAVYPDYVFEAYENGTSTLNKDYQFKSLKEIEAFIKLYKHLPGVTPIKDIVKTENGYSFNLTNLSTQTLEKVEELYLFAIEQQKALEEKTEKINALENRVEKLETLLQQLLEDKK